MDTIKVKDKEFAISIPEEKILCEIDRLAAQLNKDLANVLAAGRCADGTGFGWDILRVIPPAILTGQASAEAACLSIEMGVGVAQVDIPILQKRLEAKNVMIHFPDEYVPEDRRIIIHGIDMTNGG